MGFRLVILPNWLVIEASSPGGIQSVHPKMTGVMLGRLIAVSTIRAGV